MSALGGKVTYKGGAEFDTVSILDTAIAKAPTFGLGAGENTLVIVRTGVTGKLAYRGGADGDTVVFDQVTMPSGKATVSLGAGANLFTPTTSHGIHSQPST